MAISLVLASLLDAFIGEKKKYHPLVGFGRFAGFIESKLHSSKQYPGLLMGMFAWFLAVLPIVFLLHYLLLILPALAQTAISIVVLYFTLGQKSLQQHGMAVYKPLKTGSLSKARFATSMIVSRDTSQSDCIQLSTATVETITENTHDAVIGPLVFYVCFGPVGALLFRLSNTLDAMWGYRTERYEYFGKFSARMDDVLGFIPGRITALLFLLVRPLNYKKIIHCIRQQGQKWYSPNAGIVMAAGGAAIGAKLGGNAIYNGVEKQRLSLGDGEAANPEKIKASIALMYQASTAFIVLVLILEVILSKGNIQGLLP